VAVLGDVRELGFDPGDRRRGPYHGAGASKASLGPSTAVDFERERRTVSAWAVAAIRTVPLGGRAPTRAAPIGYWTVIGITDDSHIFCLLVLRGKLLHGQMREARDAPRVLE
jgi:hypothetical protein